MKELHFPLATTDCQFVTQVLKQIFSTQKGDIFYVFNENSCCVRQHMFSKRNNEISNLDYTLSFLQDFPVRLV